MSAEDPRNPSLVPPYPQVLYVLIDYGEKSCWKRKPGQGYINTGIVVRFVTQAIPVGRILGVGQVLFRLEYGECVTEIRFNQDENVLKAIQIVLSSGRTSEIYRFDQTTPVTMRYATSPDQGEIVGLIRAPSRVYRGAIILGIVHKYLLPNGKVGNAAFFLDIPSAWKTSTSAKCWFNLNVFCCTQTCDGDAVHCCFAKNWGCLINCKTGPGAVCCMLLSCISCLPRVLITLPFCCFFDGCGCFCLDGCRSGQCIPYCLVRCCGVHDVDPNMYSWLPHTCDHRKMPGFYPGRHIGEGANGVIITQPTDVARGRLTDVTGSYIVWGGGIKEMKENRGGGGGYNNDNGYSTPAATPAVYAAGGGDNGGWFDGGGDTGGGGADGGGGFSGDGGKPKSSLFRIAFL